MHYDYLKTSIYVVFFYLNSRKIFVGIHAAHYYFYLKGLLNSENKNPKVKTKTLTAKQQILLLHHLGVFNLPTIEVCHKKEGIYCD